MGRSDQFYILTNSVQEHLESVFYSSLTNTGRYFCCGANWSTALGSAGIMVTVTGQNVLEFVFFVITSIDSYIINRRFIWLGTLVTNAPVFHDMDLLCCNLITTNWDVND